MTTFECVNACVRVKSAIEAKLQLSVDRYLAAVKWPVAVGAGIRSTRRTFDMIRSLW